MPRAAYSPVLPCLRQTAAAFVRGRGERRSTAPGCTRRFRRGEYTPGTPRRRRAPFVLGVLRRAVVIPPARSRAHRPALRIALLTSGVVHVHWHFDRSESTGSAADRYGSLRAQLRGHEAAGRLAGAARDAGGGAGARRHHRG